VHRFFSSSLLALAGLTALGSTAEAGCGSCATNHSHDIVDTAVEAGSFKTLTAALKAAGLTKTLKGKGPFTVFAPTDAAFAKLPAGTLASLLEPENRATLTSILTHHVVAGKFTAADVMKRSTATTLNGQQVSFSTGGGVKVSGAKVIKADVDCSNGVIHVIDSVILPKPEAAQAASPLHKLSMRDIAGKQVDMANYKGRVLLIVNTASRCGYTRQYADLEALHRRYKDRGLTVLGFPCNDFGAQEPGSEAEIKRFCTERFDVSFPLFSKIHVKGPQQAPLYRLLTEAKGEVSWNFTKFLVDQHGTIVARFGSGAAPLSKSLTQAIEKALGKKASSF
jgi:glutathione peroxidase